MNCLPLVLYLLFLLDSARTASHVHTVPSSLPAPVNVYVDSVNFRHVLRWDPGPGTPPGTQYKIIRSIKGQNGKSLPRNVTQTSLKLKLHYDKAYYLMVQASYNQTLSPESRKVLFTPFQDTKIGPPQLSLTGCGNCIQINISLPEADRQSGVKDIQKLYNADFRVSWREHNKPVESFKTKDRNLTLNNLQYGMEYCVQVHTEAYLNKNTKASDWKCIFTSIEEPSRGPLAVGAVAGLLIIVAGVVMTSMYCLYYTGLLCKLKLPTALIMALCQGNTLTPETTIFDLISISSEMDKRRKEEEEEEEEEEEKHIYIDKHLQLSSGESSCQDSVFVAGKSRPGAPGDSVLTMEAEVLDAEFEVKVTHVGLDQDESKGEGAEVSIPGGVQRHVIDKEEEEEEEEKVEVEVCDSSGNINLFSVTIAALAVCEEKEKEEQNTRDSLTELLKPSNQEPLLPTDLNWTLSHTDFPTELDDQTTVPLVLPTQEDFTGYTGRHADTLSGWCDGETQEEEEEEEEEFSAYIKHT